MKIDLITIAVIIVIYATSMVLVHRSKRIEEEEKRDIKYAMTWLVLFLLWFDIVLTFAK